MAANKDSNSSKTAHVMSLLSKNRAPAPEPAKEEAAPAGPSPVPEEAPAPQAQTPAPQVPLLSSLEADAAVSSQIKDALEVELEQDAAAAEPPMPAPPKDAPSQAEEAPVISADELMGVPVPEPPKAEAPAPEADLSALENPQRPTYTNVMQILVEEKAEKYMKMFGICCCEQCQVDVKSYALNHLPPKYVVMAPDERVPKLTVYESKFSSDITAQLIQACKVVMATPHHTRPN